MKLSSLKTFHDVPKAILSISVRWQLKSSQRHRFNVGFKQVCAISQVIFVPSCFQADAILPKLDSGEEVESCGRKLIMWSKMTKMVADQSQIYLSKYGTAQ